MKPIMINPVFKIQLGLPKGSLMARSNPKRRTTKVPKIIPEKQSGFIVNVRFWLSSSAKTEFQNLEYSPTANTFSTVQLLLPSIFSQHP